MNRQIRCAKPRDLPELYEIEARSFAAPWTSAMVREELPHTWVVVGPDRRLTGFGVFHLVACEAEIFKIAVAPELRGQGIAGRLLREILGHLKTCGADKVFLEVRVSNGPAIRLYKSAGFRERGVRKGYYSDGEDALLMVLGETGPGTLPGG